MERLMVGLLSVVLLNAAPFAQAKGNLARKCIELPKLVFGIDEAGFAVSQDAYRVETGKCYSLVIQSTGKQEYAVVGDGFYRNIWLRKVEAGGLEIKATHLAELEFEDEGEAEIFFVPIVAGEYALVAKGLEHKGSRAVFIFE